MIKIALNYLGFHAKQIGLLKYSVVMQKIKSCAIDCWPLDGDEG